MGYRTIVSFDVVRDGAACWIFRSMNIRPRDRFSSEAGGSTFDKNSFDFFF
jgi:hypothetical protein